MIIIGEKLNSSIPSAFATMQESDEAIVNLIKRQSDAGARYLDINTAMFEAKEAEMMKKVASLVLANSECGLMLDSPNPEVLCEVIAEFSGADIILNSVTADERIDELAPVAAKYGCGIVVLPMDQSGIPETAEGRLECAKSAIAKLTAAGVKEENIYVDAICETLATCDTNAKVSLDVIAKIKANTNAKTTCGLSNVSFGLPKRGVLNGAFLAIALYNGLDSAIIDPTSAEIRKSLFAGEAISARDEYCMEYINFAREELMQ